MPIVAPRQGLINGGIRPSRSGVVRPMLPNLSALPADRVGNQWWEEKVKDAQTGLHDAAQNVKNWWDEQVRLGEQRMKEEAALQKKLKEERYQAVMKTLRPLDTELLDVVPYAWEDAMFMTSAYDDPRRWELIDKFWDINNDESTRGWLKFDNVDEYLHKAFGLDDDWLKSNWSRKREALHAHAIKLMEIKNPEMSVRDRFWKSYWKQLSTIAPGQGYRKAHPRPKPKKEPFSDDESETYYAYGLS